MSLLQQLLSNTKPHPIPPGIVRAHVCDAEDFDDPAHCPMCGREGLTEADFYIRRSGSLSTYCKACTCQRKRGKQ